MLMAGVEESEDDKKISFQFHQQPGRRRIPDDWILLDNQSTVNIFCNKDLLKDVRTTGRSMRIRCNAGWTVANMIRRLPGFPGEVWYYPNGIANILSLADTESITVFDMTAARKKLL